MMRLWTVHDDPGHECDQDGSRWEALEDEDECEACGLAAMGLPQYAVPLLPGVRLRVPGREPGRMSAKRGGRPKPPAAQPVP